MTEPKRRVAMIALSSISASAYLAIAASGQSLHKEGSGGHSLLVILGLFAVCFACYLTAVRLVWRSDGDQASLAIIVLGALVFRGLLLSADPIEEIDLYRYLWDGAASISGVNPFRYAPQQVLAADATDELPDDLARLVALRDRSPALTEILTRVHFGELPTIYPPVSQAVFAAATAITPDTAGVRGRMIIMKGWMVAFDLLTMALVVKLLRFFGRPATQVVIYAWCPLVIKEIANSGHVDSVAVFLTTLSCYLAARAIFPNGSGRRRRDARFNVAHFRPHPPCADGEPDGQLKKRPEDASIGPIQLAWMVNKIRRLIGSAQSPPPSAQGGWGRVFAAFPRLAHHLLHHPGKLDGVDCARAEGACGAACLLGLAVGAKLYPIVLAPLLLLSIGARRGRCEALIASLVFVASGALVLWPMWPSRTQPAWKPPASVEQAAELPPLPPEEIDLAPRDPSQSVRAFLSYWEMNDFVFLLVMENVRPTADVPQHARAWFSIAPESWRDVLLGLLVDKLSLDREVAPFVLTRGATSMVFLLLAGVFAWRAAHTPSAEEFLRQAFLTLAWFWLLLPTGNPWYWTWAMPLLPFARSRVWLALSGLAMLYYLRFWLVYHFPQAGVLGSGYAGGQFFDYVVTWLEFAPFFIALACSCRWPRI